MEVMSGTAPAQASPVVTTSAFLTARGVMEQSSAMMLQMSTGVLGVDRRSSDVSGQESVFRARGLVTRSLIAGMDQMKKTVCTENIFAGQINTSVLMGAVSQQASAVIELLTALRERMNKTVGLNVVLMSSHVRMVGV